MKPSYARHQVDLTAKALQAEAKRLGVGVLVLGGVIDAALYLGRTVRLCDWKGGRGHTLTESQAKAVAAGAPIHFISDVPQLQRLVQEMHAEQGR